VNPAATETILALKDTGIQRRGDTEIQRFNEGKKERETETEEKRERNREKQKERKTETEKEKEKVREREEYYGTFLQKEFDKIHYE